MEAEACSEVLVEARKGVWCQRLSPRLKLVAEAEAYTGAYGRGLIRSCWPKPVKELLTEAESYAEFLEAK